MNTLELKHLAPYLPYRLIIQIGSIKDGYVLEMSVEDEMDSEHISLIDVIKNNHKLLLRPLSDLTKRINNDDNNLTYSADLKLWTKEDLDFAVSNPLGLCYESICKLLEWHFDVFGLIPKGLAIDLNTIK